MKESVYISLTTIFRNQEKAYLAIQSILNQTKKPDKIFLYLSEDKSFFDEGFKNKKITNENLLDLVNRNKIDIIWGKDIGPYGKLLPLLKQKWEEDCIIITIDDDSVYSNNLIENHNIIPKNEQQIIKNAETILLEKRKKRIKPFFDNKVQTDLNCYWLYSNLYTSLILEDRDLYQETTNSINIINEKLKKNIFHCYSKGKSEIDVFLEDYVYYSLLLITEPRFLGSVQASFTLFISYKSILP